MIRIVNVDGRIGRFDIPSFLITDSGKLTIAFNGLNDVAVKHVVTLKCGDKTHTVWLGKNNAFTVSASFFKDGDVCELFLETRSEKTSDLLIGSDYENGGYLIEPLKIKKVDAGKSVVAWLQSIEAQVAGMAQTVNGIQAQLDTFSEQGVPLVAEPEYNNTEE